MSEKSRDSKILKNTMILTMGSMLAQLVTIVVSLFLTRLYSVAQIGAWSTYLSVVSVLACMITLKYENAIVLPDDDEDAINLVWLSLIICICLAVLSGIILFVFQAQLKPLLIKQGIFNVIYLLPFSLLGVGLFQVFNFWCNRKGQFKIISIRNIVNSITSAFLEVIFGITMVFGGKGIVVGSVLGTFFAGFYIAVRCIMQNLKKFTIALNFAKMKENAIKYKKFPIYSTWSSLVNQLSANLPTFLLSAYFTQEVVGYYSIAQQILSLPMLFIGNSIGQVLYSASVKAKNDGTLANLIERMLLLLISMGIVPLLLIAICAPELCSMAFGASWSEAGIYVRLLMPWLLLVFFISPLTVLFDVLGKQNQFMYLNILVLSTRFVALTVGGLLGNEKIALTLYSFFGFAYFLIVGIILLKASNVSVGKVIKSAMNVIIRHSLIYLSVPCVIVLVVSNPYFKVGICILSGMIFLLLEGKKLLYAIKHPEVDNA